MLRSCKYCGRIHDSKYQCSSKPVRRKIRTKQNSFRSTEAWKRKSLEIRERDRYLCQICIRKLYGTTQQYKINIKTQKEHVDYQRMISKGECIACGEEVIDYSVVENYVIHLLEEEYGVIVEQVGYDRYNAISSVQKMEAEGLECVEIKQHSSVLHQPTKWLKELILQQAFRYEENRLLEINFQNARCTEDTNLNKYVNKKKSTGKVDEVVALINAMYLLQQYLLNGDNFVAQTA